MKKILVYSIFAAALLAYGCDSYLEQDPEEMNSLEKIFSSDTETRKWHARMFSDGESGFMVQEMHHSGQIPYFWCTDEAAYTMEPFIRNVSEGLMTPDNYYGSSYNLYFFVRYYQAIRHCNMFLDHVDECSALGEEERRRMKAEAHFMRAYYHWLLLRLYGPIPIMTETRNASHMMDFSARVPFMDCVKWIADEIDWSIANGLPDSRVDDQLGLPDKGAALAIKSRMYLLAASPLINGNAVYANWHNNDGTALLPARYDRELWKQAADAAKEVIDMGRYELLTCSEADLDKWYKSNDPADHVKFIYAIEENYRQVTTVWSKELIWAHPNSVQWYAQCAVPGPRWAGWNGRYALNLDMANDYFMEDGTQAPELDHWFNLPQSEMFETEDTGVFTPANTFKMFVGREPRFYASMHFPNMRVTYFRLNYKDDNNTIVYNGVDDKIHGNEHYGICDFWIKGKCGVTSGDHNTSGLSVRKNVPVDYWTLGSDGSYYWQRNVAFPIIRLGEVYLNYIEALNEYDASANQTEVLKYLNLIRERAGIPGYGSDGNKWGKVKGSKSSYSQEEMRELIHHERKIELAYECNRFFDVRRWFEAHGPNGKFNHNEWGFDVSVGENATDPAFFKKTQAAVKHFDIQHYFLPIRATEVTLNRDLVQAPFY